MDTTKVLADLRAQRERINQAIASLEALNGAVVARQTPKTPKAAKSATHASTTKPNPKKRVISPEARQRMAEAQQKRWAKKKKAAKAAVTAA